MSIRFARNMATNMAAQEVRAKVPASDRVTVSRAVRAAILAANPEIDSDSMVLALDAAYEAYSEAYVVMHNHCNSK